MKIRWYGHSSFLFTTAAGTRLLVDPCAPETGYRLADIPADAVLCSHGHSDHNYRAAARGTPPVVDGAGVHAFGAARVTAVPTWHDDAGGAKRGHNLVFVIEADGLRAVHLGDLGHVPDAAQAAAIGRPDVLCIPVGGTFTIDAAGAARTVELLHPRLIVPMHYRTERLTFPLDGPEPFLAALTARGVPVRRLASCEFEPAVPVPEGRRRCCRPARPNKGGGRAKKGLPAPRRGSTMVMSPNRAVPAG